MNDTEYLLICLMEEAAEVQQIASKCLRFGLENHHPESTSTNAEELSKECTDLIAVIEMLETAKAIKAFTLFQSLKDKKEKVTTYMNVSKELGILKAGD